MPGRAGCGRPSLSQCTLRTYGKVCPFCARSSFLFFFSLRFDLEAFKNTDSFIPTTIIAFAEDKYQYFFGWTISQANLSVQGHIYSHQLWNKTQLVFSDLCNSSTVVFLTTQLDCSFPFMEDYYNIWLQESTLGMENYIKSINMNNHPSDHLHELLS